MKKGFMGAALAIIASGAMAQETYESAQLTTRDLTGTARFVGMGGAMEALGADISTMSTNPAGIGMFRRSWAGASGGVTITSTNSNTRANADLNQVGFVYSSHAGANSFFNFGFNYHKSSNLNILGNAINSLNNASLNKLVAMKVGNVQLNDEGKYDWKNNDRDDRFDLNTMLDYDVYQAVNNKLSPIDKVNYTPFRDIYNTATGYATNKDNSGYISNFEFNMSGNINDRIYLGLTFNFADVRYNSNTVYSETYDTSNPNILVPDFKYTDDRHITGSGFDVKFGIIIRPMEESPFRFGVYIHTPTWYNLRCSSSQNATTTAGGHSSGFNYEYRIVTPWRFGVSLGHTFNNKLAVGLTYEFADFSSIKNQIKERTDYYGAYSGGYYGYYNNYDNDTEMNRNTDKVLKGVHLVKLGAEYKPTPKLALRLGYNFESSAYNENGSKDYTINSYSSNGAYYSTYDFTNWKDTHRITCGIGYNLDKNWTIDLSYQYLIRQGTYHPFESISSLTCYDVVIKDGNPTGSMVGDAVNPRTESISDTPTDITVNRHQINCTLSYRF